MPRFVIHEHKSRRLHYDLRLELDKTLKSWAVPKKPPSVKGIKRLAIQVNDHSLDYIDFEGIIPEGNYGAGKVKIWDNGEFELESRKKDKIIFNLKGKKLQGEYVLLKMKEMQWLFFKTG